jgi:leucyl-tRNA synthetase
MSERYEPQQFEAKWRLRWQEAKLFRTRTVPGRPKFYGLDFFPYPSGAGLSVGHCRNYIPTDVVCRMKIMQGFNVLHPMGFDAFGLPAENEAIKRQTHPAEMIERYAATYQRQMDLIGISFDWDRSFKSSEPSYYKWTQWIFGVLFNRGLAYRKNAAVNWDPVDKTVLADEEVIGGRAERSGALVEKKYIPQWFFKITDYAQQLIDDLDTVEWPEGIKNQQRNWIGRSEGCQFKMKIAGTGKKPGPVDIDDDSLDLGNSELSFEVFTTRIDTIFGMTFCVLAPEHPVVDQLPVSDEDRTRIREYQEFTRTLSDTERQAEGREKTGCFTGAYAINPANGRKVPVWIADYVLATYGTGAIMAVPGHDQRDFDFAVKFGIDVIPVIKPDETYLATFSIGDETTTSVYQRYLKNPKEFSPVFSSKDSTLIHSGEYDGTPVSLAMDQLGTWLEAHGIGFRKIQYKLRDWLISRQRYWGCPIPIIHTRDGEMQLVTKTALPVELPKVDHYQPSGDGTSPLAHIPDFVNATDNDGRLGKRETDTMGGFACSSWYFFRFTDPENLDAPWSPEAANYWMPVDCYVGGAEHAVMHLLYARFWTKVLYDAGLSPVREPFQRLYNQGQVLALTPYRKPREGERLGVGEDGILVSFAEAKELPTEELTWRWARMSKSKGNVVTPEEMVEKYGADALRVYLLFVAPFHADVEWKSDGVENAARFIGRVFKVVHAMKQVYEPDWRTLISFEEPDAVSSATRRATHQAIQNCTLDLERFSFNTYISWLMKYVNALNDQLAACDLNGANARAQALAFSEAVETLVLLVAPGCPFSADEMWEGLGKSGFTLEQDWPGADSTLAKEAEITIAVQVNGKLRATFDVPADASKEQIEELAKIHPKIVPYLDGKTVRKVIVVPGKMVSLVVG